MMISDIEHLLLYKLAIFKPTLEKCLFRSFAHFLKTGLFVVVEWRSTFVYD